MKILPLFGLLALILLGLLLVTLATVPASKSEAAGGFGDYIWEKPWVVQNNLPPAGEQVLCELQTEVQKILETCCMDEKTSPRHLGPYYVGQGYLYEDLYWLNPAETVLVLAESLEFLPPAQQAEVIRYLKSEMQSSIYSPLTYSLQPNVSSPLLDKGSYRSFGPPLPDELAPSAVSELLVPPPENLYAVWAFAHHVSRFEDPTDSAAAWRIVEDNWSNIDALYSRIPATPRTYWQIMGAIGYARMARQLGKPYAGAEKRALTGLAAGTDYVQFYYNMGSDVGCFGNNGELDGWEGVWDYCAFSTAAPQVLYDSKNNHQGYAGEYLANRSSMFASEIGRFLQDNAQTAVVNHLNRYQSPAGAAYYPFWWENKGTKPWAVRDENTSPPGNGENAIMHPSFAWQMFMLRATAFPDQTGDSMRQFLDTPWAIGDVFHLQKLTTLLRLYSTIEWAQESPGGSYSPVPVCDGVNTGPALSYKKSASPIVANEGETVTYILSIKSNLSKPVASTTWITDTLPVELSFVSDSLSSSAEPAIDQNGQVLWSGLLSGTSQVSIIYNMTVPISLPLAVSNVATFYNPALDIVPVTKSALVFANGQSFFLPIILKLK